MLPHNDRGNARSSQGTWLRDRAKNGPLPNSIRVTPGVGAIDTVHVEQIDPWCLGTPETRTCPNWASRWFLGGPPVHSSPWQQLANSMTPIALGTTSGSFEDRCVGTRTCHTCCVAPAAPIPSLGLSLPLCPGD